VAKTSIGDFRLVPVPDIAFAQAGRDTAAVRCMLGLPRWTLTPDERR
jgi:hypothetical protein